jgi:hypothetical protein
MNLSQCALVEVDLCYRPSSLINVSLSLLWTMSTFSQYLEQNVSMLSAK